MVKHFLVVVSTCNKIKCPQINCTQPNTVCNNSVQQNQAFIPNSGGNDDYRTYVVSNFTHNSPNTFSSIKISDEDYSGR